MDNVLGILFVIVVITIPMTIIIYLKHRIKKGTNIKAIEEYKSRLIRDGFNISKEHLFVSSSDMCSIFIDQESKKWSLITGKNSPYKIYMYKDLIAFRLINEEITHRIYTQNHYRMLSEHNHCSVLKVVVQVHDPDYPIRDIVIFSPKKEINKDNIDVITYPVDAIKGLYETADRFVSLLSFIKENQGTDQLRVQDM